MMRSTVRRTAGSILMVLLLVVLGCSGSDSSAVPGTAGVYQTTSVTLSVGGSAKSKMLGAPFLGNFEDVARVTVVISGQDKYGVEQSPLMTIDLVKQANGVWSALASDLPVEPALTFTGRAYDASDVEIFSGVAVQVLTGSDDVVVVAMSPVRSSEYILFPVISSISVPEEITVSTSAAIEIGITGGADESLNFTVTSGAGAFNPAAGTITLPSSANGTINTTYTAPASPGTSIHTVKVTNSQGNSVESDFATTAVYSQATATVTVGFAPVITAISAKRTDDQVAWTATVSDDKDVSFLNYDWSFTQSEGTAGAAFSTADANPGILSGYDETVAGTITLTVTDGDGLSTTISFALNAGQFPDNLVNPPATPAPGSLDVTFNGTGIVVTEVAIYGANAQCTAIQPDGKIVVAGTSDNKLAVVRYNTDGSLDAGFGSGGIVTTPVGIDSEASGVAIQSGGKIVTAGRSTNDGSNYHFLVAQYNTDGSLDATFGTGGIVTTVIASDSDAGLKEIAIQSDGKIVVSGGSFSGNFYLARYNTDGSLDGTFGSGGIVTTAVGTNGVYTAAESVAIQTDGKIVAAGNSSDGTNDSFAVVRYNSDGSLDSGFGSGGIVTTPVGISSWASGVAIQTDGKIVASGSSRSTGDEFGLVRYNTDGSLDMTFGTDGIVITDGINNNPRNVVIQTDGKIVVVGCADNAAGIDFALIRYDTDGSFDATFGSGGIVITTIGTSNYAMAVAIQADGKIVVVGTSQDTFNDFTVVRYNP